MALLAVMALLLERVEGRSVSIHQVMVVSQSLSISESGHKC